MFQRVQKEILYLFNSLWIICILWIILLSWVYIRQSNGIQLPSTFNLYQRRLSRVKEVLRVEVSGFQRHELRARHLTQLLPHEPHVWKVLLPKKSHLLIVNLSACFLKLKIYFTVSQHFCSCWADMIPTEASYMLSQVTLLQVN